MNHKAAQERLSPWRDKELPEAERRELEAHLSACADCRQTAAQWDKVSRAFFNRTPAHPSPSETFVQGVMDRLDAEEERVSVPAWPAFRWLAPSLSLGFAALLIFFTLPASEDLVSTEDLLTSNGLEEVFLPDETSETPDIASLLGI